MRKYIIAAVLILSMLPLRLFAQGYGGNLNIGAGLGYRGYLGRPLSGVMLNYEFNAAPKFTLAPFVGLYTYNHQYYWGNKNYPYRYYNYRETAVPLGIKGSYYFDNLVQAGPKWDFYAGASIGFVFRTITWDNGYYGDVNAVRESSPLFLAGHLGTRFHINPKVGIYLDLSSAISTLGFSFKI